MRKKLEIYKDILSRSLYLCRNLQSRSSLSKAMDKVSFLEIEFVHNIPISILESDFTEHDIWILNNQAKNYLKRSNELISPNFSQHKKDIQELVSLLPEERKAELKQDFLELLEISQ